MSDEIKTKPTKTYMIQMRLMQGTGDERGFVPDIPGHCLHTDVFVWGDGIHSDALMTGLMKQAVDKFRAKLFPAKQKDKT